MHFIVENRDFDVKKDDVFVLRGSKYRVKGIDSSLVSVLIEDTATAQETNIEKETKDEQETKEVKDEKDTANKKKTPGSATR
jgi:hypothetical protein